MCKTYKARIFSVRGRGRFPIDMLRYDSCWPFQTKDSAAIEADGVRTVTLESASPNRTAARWRSFGWEVVE